MKLTIRRKDPDVPAYTAADLEFKLDGIELTGLTHLDLSLRKDAINRVVLSIEVDDLDVDVDGLAELMTEYKRHGST